MLFFKRQSNFSVSLFKKWLLSFPVPSQSMSTENISDCAQCKTCYWGSQLMEMAFLAVLGLIFASVTKTFLKSGCSFSLTGTIICGLGINFNSVDLWIVFLKMPSVHNAALKWSQEKSLIYARQ